MGQDKALLEMADGRTMVQHAADRLARVCADVVVASGSSRPLTGFRTVPDGPGRGPVAGILGAAESAASPETEILVLACDLPAVPVELLRALVSQDPLASWVLPRWRRGLEPLCALYRPEALAALRQRAERGRFALHTLESKVVTAYLEGDALHMVGRPEEMFLNVNTAAEFKIWSGRGLKDSVKAKREGG